MDKSLLKISKKLDKIFYSQIPKELETVSNAFYGYSQFVSKIKLHRFLTLPATIKSNHRTSDSDKHFDLVSFLGLESVFEDIELAFDEIIPPEEKLKDQMTFSGSNFKIIYTDLFRVDLEVFLNPAQAINNHEELIVLKLRVLFEHKPMKKKIIKIQEIHLKSVEFYGLEGIANGLQHVESIDTLQNYYEQQTALIQSPNINALSPEHRVEALDCLNAYLELDVDVVSFFTTYVAEIINLKLVKDAITEFLYCEYCVYEEDEFIG